MLNMVALTEGCTVEGTEEIRDFANELMTYKMQILVSDKTNIIFSDSIIRQVHCDEKYTRFIEMYINSPYVEQIFSSDKSTLEKINQSYHFYMIDIKKLFTERLLLSGRSFSFLCNLEE